MASRFLFVVLFAARGAVALRITRRSLGAAAAAAYPAFVPLRPARAAPPLVSDEVSVTFADAAVGVELSAVGFARATLGNVPSTRPTVVGVAAGSEAARRGVEEDWVVVSVGGRNVERATVAEVADALARAPRPTALVFRDPARFPDALEAGSGARGATTTVLPASGPYERQQTLAVERLSAPPVCASGAVRGDLLEVRYEGRLASDGSLFDGSAITFSNGAAIPGRGGDATIYFVLGQQPLGQFPTAWDPSMTGACVGEVRRLTVPPVLGFGDKGSPKRNVPPFAFLEYTLQLMSINGNAQPR